ncbi:MAG: hypothetical protein ACTSUC_09885 [Promethearchaeota archaeon]
MISEEEKRKRKREANRKWYQKNREYHIKKVKARQKETNYTTEKRPEARKRRYIKRFTRNKYPLKNSTKCQICGNKATEHHHNSIPIQKDKFLFVCHNCHIDQDRYLRLIKSQEVKNGRYKCRNYKDTHKF